MATSEIQRITLESIPVRSSFPGGGMTRDEAICLYTDGGSVILRRSAVTKAGSSWQKLRLKLWQDAGKLGIPIEDLRPKV